MQLRTLFPVAAFAACGGIAITSSRCKTSDGKIMMSSHTWGALRAGTNKVSGPNGMKLSRR